MTAAGALLGRRVRLKSSESGGGVVVGVAFFQSGEDSLDPDQDRGLAGFWLLVASDAGELLELPAVSCRIEDVRRWVPLVGETA